MNKYNGNHPAHVNKFSKVLLVYSSLVYENTKIRCISPCKNEGWTGYQTGRISDHLMLCLGHRPGTGYGILNSQHIIWTMRKKDIIQVCLGPGFDFFFMVGYGSRSEFYLWARSGFPICCIYEYGDQEEKFLFQMWIHPTRFLFSLFSISLFSCPCHGTHIRW